MESSESETDILEWVKTRIKAEKSAWADIISSSDHIARMEDKIRVFGYGADVEVYDHEWAEEELEAMNDTLLDMEDDHSRLLRAFLFDSENMGKERLIALNEILRQNS